jgi:antitoxin component HigA of HigAB toxin-antitoxin module
MMKLKPIRNEKEYEAALRAVSPLFDKEPEPGSPEADQFGRLVLLIENYESEHYPIMPPDPVEAIRFRMEQAGLTIKEYFPIEVAEMMLAGGMPIAKAWREYLGLSQADVATRLGITQGAYSRIEKKTLKPDMQEKLARAFEIDPEQLDF